MYECNVSIGKFSRRNTILLVLLCNLLAAYTIEAQGVISFSPAQNDLSVPRNTNITATFNEALDTSTLTNASIRVWGNQTGFHVSTFSYDSAAYTLIIDPSVDFLPGEVATIALTNNIHTVGGQPSARFVWNFIIGVTPSPGKFLSKTIRIPALDCGTRFFASADLNLDGKIDFVEFEYEPGRYACGALHSLMNNGDGTFQVKDSPMGVEEYLNHALADFNGDGFTDLAIIIVIDYGSHTLLVWANNGDGTFQGIGGNLVGTASSITTGDFDGDGDMDIATVTTANSVSILKNNGNGSFQSQLSSPLNRSPYKLTPADVDRDGAIDLVCLLSVSPGSDSISVLKNNGDGSFQRQRAFPIGGDYGTSLAAADFDGDGAIDMAVGVYPDSVRIFRNNGDGTLQLLHSYASVWQATSIVTSDFDGDGDIDLFAPFIMMNNGEGEFQQEWYSAGGYSAQGDIDTDGDVDLVGAGGGQLFILKNRNLVSVAVDSLIFDPLHVGYYSYRSFKLNNFSDSAIDVTNITSTNAKFSIFNETSFSVAAGDSHIVVVRYTPTAAQTDTGTIAVFPSGYPVEKVSLRGSGIVIVLVPVLVVTPTLLSFGSTTIGKISDLILNIKNIGRAGLSVTNITHSNNRFSITGPISFTVPPGETYPIMTSFSLNALGIQNDVLRIYSNDSTNNPLNISMTGSGTSTLLPEISISPFELRFDSIAVGQSDTLSLRLYNLGASNLNVTGMSTTDSAYSVLNVNSFTISAGDSINALIRFMSTYNGRQQGFLTISSNDPNENLLTIRLTNAPKILVGVKPDELQIPESYFLFQNYPNPFNPVTTINFGIPRVSYVTLKVYNIIGQEIATLVSEEKQPGLYRVHLNADHLVSGVYFYRLQTNDYVETKKLLLMR